MKVTGMWYKTLILLLILMNIGCDQVSKYLVRGNIAYYEQVELIKDNLILTKVENTGGFLGFGSAIHPVLNQGKHLFHHWDILHHRRGNWQYFRQDSAWLGNRFSSYRHWNIQNRHI